MLKGRRVLITGATGFIGGRLVERLILQEQADVVALVNQFKTASRLARFPVRMVAGSVTDPAVVKRAAEGCDVLVHCAVSFSGKPEEDRRVAVEGTRNMCEAAKACGAHLVHFSTISVYGDTPAGHLTEDSAKNPGADAYGSNKLEAERVVQSFQQEGLRATILQPTIVYGPWSFWSSYVIGQMAKGQPVLPDGGSGLCNAVYIDDVIDAVLLSLRPGPVRPGPYLISGSTPVTWRDYYVAHSGLDRPASVSGLTAEELAALEAKRQGKTKPAKKLLPGDARVHLRAFAAQFPILRKAYRIYRRVRPNRLNMGPAVPRILPLADHLPLLSSKTSVDIAKAAAELGYSPKVSLSEGTALTIAWAKWCGLQQRP